MSILSSRIPVQNTTTDDLAALSIRHNIHISGQRLSGADTRHFVVVVTSPRIVACADTRYVVPALVVQVVRRGSRVFCRGLIR